MSKVFITSDTHFGHENILAYENRPFQTVKEMDDEMVFWWNRAVSKNDVVFHLGDVAIMKAKEMDELLPRLNGRKHLILGNHDSLSKSRFRKLGFQVHSHYFYDGCLFTHKPMDRKPLEEAESRGLLWRNVHGHVHSNDEHLDTGLYANMSVERWGYRPIRWSVAKAYIRAREMALDETWGTFTHYAVRSKNLHKYFMSRNDAFDFARGHVVKERTPANVYLVKDGKTTSEVVFPWEWEEGI